MAEKSASSSKQPPPVRASSAGGTLDDRSTAASLDELRRAYRIVFGSEGGFWERDLASGAGWFSPALLELLGSAAAPPAGRLIEQIHPDDRPEFERRQQQAVATLGSFEIDLRYKSAHGDERWARVHGRAWPGADGAARWLIGSLADVDPQKQAQLGLERLTEQFSRAMHASLEVHFEGSVADERFSIGAHINTLLGHPPGTPPPTREQFLSWVHPDDLARLREATLDAERAAGAWRCTYRLRLADGGYRWFQGRGRTELLPDGRARLTGLIGDIHEQHLASEELVQHSAQLQRMVDERTARLEQALGEAQRLQDAAERANEAKSTFLAQMSHEIRTPLNGLLGLNELALREARSVQQRRYLKLALQSGAGLLEMLNGVLDFSRLNAGAAPPRVEAFDLAEALATALRRVMPQARVKGLGVMYDYLGPVTRVAGDEQRLQQIAANLLTNAIKYTENGYVALRAEVLPRADGHCQATIEVADTGPGMSPEIAARVFDPFVQGDESLARRHGGAGLGLSIARGLADSLGGTLQLETAPGAGARFTLQLPLQMQPGEQPMNRLPAPGHAWLVYNRPVPAEWLATRLARLGWTSEIIPGMPALLTRAAQLGTGGAVPPDLIVLAEAALDTPTSLDQLREQLPGASAVLLVRPDWNQPPLEAAARHNAMPLVFMPLTPGSLLELTEQHGRSTRPAESGFVDLGPDEMHRFDILIAEDNPVNQLIVAEMVATLGFGARLARDGAEAIEACHEQAPDLLLMDLQMPVVDGIAATRRLVELQAQGRLPPFPIIALTAHATPQDRERCLDAGMKGYLTKPINLAQLRSELRRWTDS